MAQSFSKAFAAARKEKGAGGTFTWNGKKYSTNYKNETKSSSSAPAKSTRPKSTVGGQSKPKAKPSGPTSRPNNGKPEPTRPKSPTAPKTSSRPNTGTGGKASGPTSRPNNGKKAEPKATPKAAPKSGADKRREALGVKRTAPKGKAKTSQKTKGSQGGGRTPIDIGALFKSAADAMKIKPKGSSSRKRGR